MIRAACLVLFCCSFSAVTAQQAVAQGARTTETVVVRSAVAGAPACRRAPHALRRADHGGRAGQRHGEGDDGAAVAEPALPAGSPLSR